MSILNCTSLPAGNVTGRFLVRAAVVIACACCLIPQANCSSLVAEYLFQNASNLGLDSTGNGNGGAVQGTLTQGTGPFAGWSSAIFNGSSNIFVNHNLNGGYNIANGFSFTAWVNLSSAGSGNYNGFFAQDGQFCCINRLLVTPGDSQILVDAGVHGDMLAGSGLPYGQWAFIALTADNEPNTVARIYLNGVQVGGSPVNYATTLANVNLPETYIGSGEGTTPIPNGTNSYYLFGSMADARIYSGALSGSEVLSIFQNQPAGTVPEPSTLAFVVLGALALAIFHNSTFASVKAGSVIDRCLRFGRCGSGIGSRSSIMLMK